MRELRSYTGSVATPWPVRRRLTETCTDRVKDDVPDCLHQVRLVLHQFGIEAIPDEVSGPAVSLVGSHGVTRIEHLHPPREAAVRDLHKEVKVIAHEAVRKAFPPRAFDRETEQK